MVGRNHVLRNAVRAVWALLNAASILAWVLSLGVGSIVGALASDALSLSQPWQGFFFVGVLMMTSAIAVPVSSALLYRLVARLPAPKPASGQSGGFMSSAFELAAAEQRKKHRAALHEVITTLEDHKADVERYTQAQSPRYQGLWPENRQELAGEPQYDRAVRATERAFQAIGYHTGQAAIDPIDEALTELEAALNDEGPGG